jgi:hypothetical protein
VGHDHEPSFEVLFRKRDPNSKIDRLLPSRVPVLNAQVSPLCFAKGPRLKNLTKTVSRAAGDGSRQAA